MFIGKDKENNENYNCIFHSPTGEETCECTCKDYHKNICSQTESQTQDVFHSALRYNPKYFFVKNIPVNA